jgi:ferredoxin
VDGHRVHRLARALLVVALGSDAMKDMRMKIKTIPSNCIASGNCTLVAPDLFGQDDKGVVVARMTHPSAAQLAHARSAAAACPVAAIELIELEDDVGTEE